MPRDGEEIRVLTEQLGVVADRDGGDQAVGQLARRLSLAPAEPVQLRGLLVVGLVTGIYATSLTSKLGTTSAPAPPSRARMRVT